MAISQFQSGLEPKPAGGKLTINFPQPFSNGLPNVIVSPYWQDQVGFIETIISVTNTGFTVVSENKAPDYQVSWIAAAQDQQRTVNETVQSGLINKTAAGQLKITFPTAFTTPPNVVVSPYWPTEVGYIETIVEITKDHFTITSQNAGSNYQVSWIAVT
jgi:hypothetical protein